MTRIVPSNWERALLVCGKCSRKVGGGFGRKGRTPLAKALRRELGVGKGRKARIGVTEVKCLGLCPKRAVTLVDTGDLGRWRLVTPGENAGEVVRAVLGEAGGPPAETVLVLTEAGDTVVVASDEEAVAPFPA